MGLFPVKELSNMANELKAKLNEVADRLTGKLDEIIGLLKEQRR